MSQVVAYPAETHTGVVTSWIPLTTTFIPSSGCESIFRLNGPSLVAFDPGYGLDIQRTVKCAPSAVTTWWEQARLGFGGEEHTAISIGPMTCPLSWTTVATYVTDKSTTQIMCCPSGYLNEGVTKGPVNGDCFSSVAKGAVLTFASTSVGDSEHWSIVSTTMASSSYVGAIAVVGYKISRAESSSTPISGPDSLIPSSSTASSSLPTTTPAPDEGMSTALKAGIGLGVSLGVIGIIALIFAIAMLRRRSQRRSPQADAAATLPVAEDGESKPMPTYGNSSHLPQYQVHELDDSYQRHEMDRDNSPVELGS